VLKASILSSHERLSCRKDQLVAQKVKNEVNVLMRKQKRPWRRGGLQTGVWFYGPHRGGTKHLVSFNGLGGGSLGDCRTVDIGKNKRKREGKPFLWRKKEEACDRSKLQKRCLFVTRTKPGKDENVSFDEPRVWRSGAQAASEGSLKEKRYVGGPALRCKGG